MAQAQEWKRKKLLLATDKGERFVKGWSNGVFGIDRRRTYANEIAWTVTHIKTGFGALSWIGSLPYVQSLVDEFTNGEDWDFSDPREAPKRSEFAKAFKEKHKKSFVISSELRPREYADAMIAEREKRDGKD